ncbi:class I SAM-dependent RNA methyltransferase [Frankia gtarii]|uniref:class I SAM-dependent RNA methyltransferase n=1 Tax=Frankia gtarii TaxID=2950102 RepID=UPI0021BEAF31|nr:TRAM domain-containing protein [Frankia gtarii]
MSPARRQPARRPGGAARPHPPTDGSPSASAASAASGSAVEDSAAATAVGSLIELVVGQVAHGGFCVARAGGRVVFVRHALPGERVRARVTDDSHDRYWRADAVDILTPSPQRVEAPCPHAGPGACGGCDWQHADLAAQRRGKAEVIAEALRRFGGLDAVADPEAHPGSEAHSASAASAGRQGAPGTRRGPVRVVVEAVPVGGRGDRPGGDGDDGLGWRTRMRFAVTAQGEIGLRASRSHTVVAVPGCRIAHPLVAEALAGRRFPGAEAVEVAASPSTGQVAVAVYPVAAAPGEVVETVGERRFQLGPDVFWQVHPGAPEVLVAAVRDALRPRAGETALDLYSGAGLFAAFLAVDVGPGGRVVAMESDAAAVAAAARSLADLPQVSLRSLRVTPATVRGVVGSGPTAGRVDTAVLDPPRTGAGPAVMAALLAHHPRAVAYVACDPVALGRDLAAASAAGYELISLRAFDLFPMTAHVECVALLEPRVIEPAVTKDLHGVEREVIAGADRSDPAPPDRPGVSSARHAAQQSTSAYPHPDQ